MVFQSFHLFPHYNVMKNLCDAPIHVQKRNRAEVEAQAEELLGKMGLTGKEKAYPCQLSGGQCQRVAIARALMKKASVYVFDDSFSALDFKTDAKLRQALQQDPEIKNSVVVIVAQRVSTVLSADVIIVLDGGEVVGKGTHEELLKTNETYREIVNSQIRKGDM